MPSEFAGFPDETQRGIVGTISAARPRSRRPSVGGGRATNQESTSWGRGERSGGQRDESVGAGVVVTSRQSASIAKKKTGRRGVAHMEIEMNNQNPVATSSAAPNFVPQPTPPEKKKRGFAAMDRTQVRELARKGGIAAHRAGTAHEFSSDEARAAGRKGGLATHSGRKAAQQTQEGQSPPSENQPS